MVIPAKAGIQRGGDGCGKLALNRLYGATLFSSLGVPVPAGMSDWYENGLMTANSSVPAKAGIQKGREARR